MAVENIRSYPAGSVFTLANIFKKLPAGTQVSLVEINPLGGIDMAMVDPGEEAGKPFAIHPKMLNATEPADDAANIEGQVLDFFVGHANMEHQLGLNFFGAYLAAVGDNDDLSVINMLVTNADLQIGQQWTMEQTAALYGEFQEMYGLEADPLIAVTLAEEDAARAAAAKKVVAPPKPTVVPAKSAATATQAVPAAAAQTRVDKKSWTPNRIDAFTLLGPLGNIYANNPDGFEKVVALAVRMVMQADSVRET